jgi:hypothetical protein
MISKDKLKHWVLLHWGYIFYVAVFLFYSICLYQCGRRHAARLTNEVSKTTTQIVSSTDKLPKVISTKPLYLYRYIRPKQSSSNTLKLKNEVFGKTEQPLDTVPIPITQQKYEGTNYTAYVSGFHQQLDSIEVRERVITNTIVKKRSRWNIGISAGYACTPKGLSPYIGVGVTWNIFR